MVSVTALHVSVLYTTDVHFLNNLLGYIFMNNKTSGAILNWIGTVWIFS